jgi:hypothetical protein
MMSKTRMIIGLTALIFLLVGCRSERPVETEAEVPAAETAVTEQQTTRQRRELRDRSDVVAEPTADTRRVDTGGIDPSRTLPRLRGELDEDSYGPEMFIDGSSPEAFLQSLEMIASESSVAQYQQIDGALHYIQTYSFSDGGLPALYRSLDGLSGEDLIRRAGELRAQQRGR